MSPGLAPLCPQPTVQHDPMNAQITGCLRCIPITGFHLPPDFFERRGDATSGMLHSNGLERQVGGRESWTVSKHRRTQDNVLQLAHLPRPGVLHQKRHCRSGEVEMGKSLGVKKVARKQWDIFQPFP